MNPDPTRTDGGAPAETGASPDAGEPEVPCHWSARKLTPTIVLYVAAVFVGFAALAYFVVHSLSGVKALAVAAVGGIVPLLASLGKRVEYRLTAHGLEHRPLNPKKPGEFKDLFQWDQLSHVVPLRRGFKYYKHLNESNPLRRFWKAHVSDACSGEVHVEIADQERVLGVVARRGIPFR